MALRPPQSRDRPRSSSASTIRASTNKSKSPSNGRQQSKTSGTEAIIWIHDDVTSLDHVLFKQSILDDLGVKTGDLVLISQASQGTDTQDFQVTQRDASATRRRATRKSNDHVSQGGRKLLCTAKSAKGAEAEVSISKSIAATFGFESRNRVVVEPAEVEEWSASHVEICFRDAYLSRSDMWRFSCQELVDKVLYVGQKISMIGSMKSTIKSIHINGKFSPVAYFSGSSTPVFRSEAARYVIYVQMSREMWDFDSEGNGEIMFNRVVNGFLPELFKRWSALDVRHLVSIVMFGRLEYNKDDLMPLGQSLLQPSSNSTKTQSRQHQDFYRVVVTDMASAQWTTILEELKKDFRVFLRDVSLFEKPYVTKHALLQEADEIEPTLISGRLSPALKGNILEAINLAASQFSNDYIDRDLIRTGVSTVIVTAGTGVFDVERDLLALTSETLTNNGIGIDVVCLSQMPLHSVPLFRYRLPERHDMTPEPIHGLSPSPSNLASSLNHPSIPNLSNSPAFSNNPGTSLSYFSRFPAAFPPKAPQLFGYGIPQWVDLSYWSMDQESMLGQSLAMPRFKRTSRFDTNAMFVPRVRMYELQMMGLMEMGMADIRIEYLDEDSTLTQRGLRQKGRSRRIQGSYSLSQSPEVFSKSPAPMSKYKGLLSASRAGEESSKVDLMTMMDKYDDESFHYDRIRSSPSPPPSDKNEDPQPQRCSPATSTITRSTIDSRDARDASPVQLRRTGKPRLDDSASETSSIISAATNKKIPRLSRNLSYAFRGLVPKASVARPEVNVENINANVHVSKGPDALTNTDAAVRSADAGYSSVHHPVERASARTLTAMELDSTAVESTEPMTKPIMITRNKTTTNIITALRAREERVRDKPAVFDAPTENPTPANTQAINSHSASKATESDVVSASVPVSGIPFVRNVNASNPLKRGQHATSLGRWQHLYPRKPRAATVKWLSLCTPASIPLTTEDFPTAKDLARDWESSHHVVHLDESDNLTEDHKHVHLMQLMEMVSLRLAHGYQFVIGSRLHAVWDDVVSDGTNILDPSGLVQGGKDLVMIMGNTIQRIDCRHADSIDVTKYVRKAINVDMPIMRWPYNPYVRTILSDEYSERSLVFQALTEQYPWNIADNHLHEDARQRGDVIEDLRFWRARFVLIPVEPPSSTFKLHQNNETEEEIHLIGIRALTQIWQKNKYLSAHERQLSRARMTSGRRRDQNPLEIKIETLNPSELVATELDRLLQLEETGDVEMTHLLPEPQKVDRETPIHKIAQLMQSERGIEIKNRRWHLRLHYNCFHGEELTNWLLHNVKNVESRADAVEFGNQLMHEGLFEHVNSRHNFKDGHYFYSIRPEYRAPRMDQPKSWFSSTRQQPGRSIPPTPLSEQAGRDMSPLTVRTKSASSLAHQLTSTPSPEGNRFTSTDRKRKTVSLSRTIRVDVDPRKKSFLHRPEVVNVHYDRFHSPENCYHLELNWLNTTCKLVDEAIISWTNTAEKYGLKLVEVPIAEAFEVPVSEPFRSPYRIKLALEPPKRRISNVTFNSAFFTSTSFGPQQPSAPNPPDKHIYHKALLKRFNFVLDLEAISEFPENVDIMYSWGRLDYKYTQFVHRSGVVLAQILDDGDIILLANRLYNARLANTKESSNRMYDPTKDTGVHAHRPPVPQMSTLNNMQASGIIGLNVASPSGTAYSSSPRIGPSPSLRGHPSAINMQQSSISHVIADTFGPKAAFNQNYLGNNQFITPEQIKGELQSFCSNKLLLEHFYKEVASAPPTNAPGSRKQGSSSSSLLKPVRELPGSASDINGIPAFELPESVNAMSNLRRATVAYENVNEMFEREKGSAAASMLNSTIIPPKRRQDSTGTVGSGSADEAGVMMGVSDLRQARNRAASGVGVFGKDSPLRKATS